MSKVTGRPAQGLFGATLGFFVGFAAVALFGPTAKIFQEAMGLSPLMVSLLVAMPSLSGALLRIPFAAWVDLSGGRRPMVVLLCLSVVGMVGLTGVVLSLYPDRLSASIYPLMLLLGLLSGCGIATFSVGIGQVSYWYPQKRQGSALAVYAGVGNLAPGLFSLLLPMALAATGLGNCYLIWLLFLIAGTILYAVFGRNSWYFQYLRQGHTSAEARRLASEQGQELFPTGNLVASLRTSARAWRTWALVWIYFTTFGGFIALTAWLPTYSQAYFGLSALQAGLLTGGYSILTSLVRVLGGVLSDKLREGGENTAILALLTMIVGALIMVISDQFEIALPGILLLAFGMGLCNAAVFKIVPQAVPQAVGGAAGWVGGLGALGGFLIPLALGFAANDLGKPGYAIGFVVFVFLGLFSLSMAWLLKYAEDSPSDTATDKGATDG